MPRLLDVGTRVCQLHRADRLAVCRLGRHSHQRQGRGHAADATSLFLLRRRGPGQSPGHHRRFDAADPALDSDEQIPHHGVSHRLLHLHRVERGRLPDADRRSAAVPGLSRRAFRSGGWRSIAGRCGRSGVGVSAGDVLRGGPASITAGRRAKCGPTGGDRARDSGGSTGLCNLVFLAVILGAVFIEPAAFRCARC